MLTIKGISKRYGVSPRSICARLSRLRAKGVKVGRKLGGQWILTERDARKLAPGKPGRPPVAPGSVT